MCFIVDGLMLCLVRRFFLDEILLACLVSIVCCVSVLEHTNGNMREKPSHTLTLRHHTVILAGLALIQVAIARSQSDNVLFKVSFFDQSALRYAVWRRADAADCYIANRSAVACRTCRWPFAVPHLLFFIAVQWRICVLYVASTLY
jgi:hypothetical protein